MIDSLEPIDVLSSEREDLISSSENNKPPPKSAFQRAGKLLKTGFGVARSEANHRLKSKFSNQIDKIESLKGRIRTEQIKALTKTLGELKGSALKAGQMLALEAQDWIPEDLQKILYELFDKVQPVDDVTMLEFIKTELGSEKFERLALESKSFAAASIGQVYLGSLENQKIVTKVQYPGVSETVDSDINALRFLASSFTKISGKKAELHEFFEELKIILKNETDYNKEITNMTRYADFLKKDNRFVLPRPIPEYSNQRVITMSYVEGIPIANWLETNPPQEEKERLAKNILDLFCIEFYENGFVQTDPNLGNFKINSNTGQLVLLDFGATIEYSKEFIEEYSALLRTLTSGKKSDLFERAIQFDLISEKESPESFDRFLKMMEISILPFDKDQQPFDFSDKDYRRETQKLTFDFIKSIKYTPPPRHLVFLHRKLGGIFSLLKKMEIKMDLSSYWNIISGTPSTRLKEAIQRTVDQKA